MNNWAQDMGIRLLRLLIIVGLIAGAVSANASREKNHYEFILPDGYIGWICVMFNDPSAEFQVNAGEAYLVPISEDGTYHTRSMRVLVMDPTDIFVYKETNSDGTSRLKSLPPSYVLGRADHGGFMVSVPRRGGAWFLFIGPPEVRATVRFADWDAEVKDRIKKYGTGDLGPPDPLPIPGRMPLAISRP